MGATTYKLLKNLLSSVKPDEKAYSDLVAVLTEHYNPAPSEIVQQFKFHSHCRKGGETVATFLSELRSLAQHCNFGAALDNMLRDRFVCGIQDDSIQRRLLSELKLTL